MRDHDTIPMFDEPVTKPIDEHTQAVLALVRGNPLHDRDRERIVAAIFDEAKEHGGRVNPNRVRSRLTSPISNQLDVNPRVIGAVYSALTGAGVLAFVDFCVSTDTAGKNRGKPARVYHLTRTPTGKDHQ